MVQSTRNVTNRQKWKHIAEKAVPGKVEDLPNIIQPHLRNYDHSAKCVRLGWILRDSIQSDIFINWQQ